MASLFSFTLAILFLAGGVSYAQQEHQGITMRGKPIILVGPELKTGDKAPDFVVQSNDMSDAKLSGFSGLKLIASVPSLDTPVCNLEIHRFNQEAASISKDIHILFISMDLPFAQKRFCGATGITNVQTLSDHRTADFGSKYGVLIQDMRLLARAIFIVDQNNVIRYVEYVKEQSKEPDYQKALDVLKGLSKA